MPEMLEYVREKLYRLEGKIVELLTGLNGYKLGEVKARVPDVRRVADARLAPRLPPSDSPCDRY